MKKKIISLVLMVALIITVFSSRSIYKGMDVSAEEFRNGYALIPQKYDSTGIDTETTFLLKADENEALTLQDITSGFEIDVDIEFEAKETEEGYIITLKKELDKNSLYTFKFKDATWTYQTMSDFSLLGVLPRNESANVPTNTGIEFYFSHEGAKVDGFFEIEPKVEGKFESHGNVVVFAPKGGLEPKTIYKITVKKGLELKESDQKLMEDFVFSFETSPKDNEEYKQPSGHFNFNNIINEFGTTEVPKIPMNYYINKQENAKKPIGVNVYAYKNMDDFAAAINKYSDIPRWSYYGFMDEKIETKGLSKVISFEQPIAFDNYDQQFLNLPDTLPSGFYVVDCQWQDVHFQTFIQVTDLSFYYMGSGANNYIGLKLMDSNETSNSAVSASKNIIWLNDLKTGQPVKDAVVSIGDKQYISNEKGIVEISVDNKNDDNNSIYKIQAGNKSAVLMEYTTYGYGRGNNSSNDYWKYFQTDRGLYKPDDTVEFWGFLQNRYEDETIQDITVEVSQGGYFYWEFLPYHSQDMAYEKTTIKADNGFYKGSIQLPNLEEGSYQISVKHKDNIISNRYIEVKNYTKPAYKIELSKDKEAIFLDEVVNFEINTLFYEGTPVSNLEANYNINGMGYKDGVVNTDKNGNSKIAYKPTYIEGNQGIQYAYFNAFARLPESGEIYGNEQVRIFVNDINVDILSKRENKEGTLTVKVNKYDLTRLNNGTAEDDYDYLGAAKEGQKITGTIYRNEWKKKEIGEYYDFINKVVRKRYDYYQEKKKLKDVTLVTDKEGKAEIIIDFPDVRDCYYTAELNTVDSNGRKMTFNQYFGERWRYSPYDNEQDRYRLTAEKDTYNVDEAMKMRFVNNEELLGKGNYLYVTAQNGIKEYEVTNSPEYTKDFDESLIPNADIRGVYFNGKTYIEADVFRARFNVDKNKIVFTAETDKEGYKPGEECTVTLKAMVYSEKEKKLIPAKDVYVNISLVDEALLTLHEQQIDTLQELYAWVDGGIGFTYGSHNNLSNNMIVPMRYGMMMEKSESAKQDMAMDDSLISGNAKADFGSAEVYVRSVFKDTALFQTMKLDEKGHGTFTFKLPDNVTSWRMTFAGISKTLKAGSDKQELSVSLPYFINTSLNKTYLVGDQPFIGVSAYGKELKEGENISYQVTAEGTDYKATATGKAFQRVNIPLWEMEEGTYNIIVKAISESGLSDGIKQTIKVVKTYHEIEVADYYDLVKGMSITTNDAGITKLIMMDKGRGKFLPMLYSLAYSGGKRIDQKYLAYNISEMLTSEFGMDDIVKDEVKLSDYQTQDGGYAILPYAESDIATTVKLLPIIKDDINKEKVKMYLYNELNNAKSRNKAAAIYGLAVLDEPILLELQKAGEIANLQLKDYLYLALAYSELGDKYKAKAIYNEKVAEYVEAYETVKRVKYGKTDDSYLEHTALMMVLASNLDMEDKDLYYEYVTQRRYSKEILVNTEIAAYIQNEISKVSDKEPKVVYSYQGETFEKVIENGWPVTVKIPSSNLDQFDIKSVEGDAALVAVYDKPLVNDKKQDSNIKVSKSYYNYTTDKMTNTFDQSDIVKVVIDVDIDKDAIDDYYTVTDFAPSGLVPIESTWRFGLRNKDGYYYYKDVEGQKVTMHISKHYQYDKELYYYARVITPGTYKADGTIVTGNRVKDSVKISNTSEIIINK